MQAYEVMLTLEMRSEHTIMVWASSAEEAERVGKDVVTADPTNTSWESSLNYKYEDISVDSVEVIEDYEEKDCDITRRG